MFNATMADQTGSTSINPLKELVEQIWISRTITREEQARLMELVMEDGQVSPEEKSLMDKVWKGLTDGRIRVVD